MTDPNDIVFQAAAFAARAHRHQVRKDHETPYVSHVYRVCLVVRQVFGFDDPRMLAAALLHDTIEDTSTDCDDIIEKFGDDVAAWVAALTKDMRLSEEPREAEYKRRLAAAPWQVKACKLADIYDNLGDCQTFTPVKRQRTAKRSRDYLDAMRPGLPEEVREAFRLTEERLTELEKGLTAG
jgi:guanosine-3',5'-bis(diphosphate) 3'-pyrophosphohydrolase